MKRILLGLTVLVLSGCSAQEFIINGGQATTSQDEMQVFFVGGIGQDQQLDAASVCGGVERIVSVETSWQPVDILISMFSSSVIYPRTATVKCR